MGMLGGGNVAVCGAIDAVVWVLELGLKREGWTLGAGAGVDGE
jgi:hypothetical protein